MITHPRVGVLMGGPSSEHDISLMTGINILKTLEAGDRWRAVSITITKAGHWLYGNDRAWCNPGEAIAKVDVIYNALHGAFGEDGKVQQILEHHQIPYTGSGVFASAVAMNKIVGRKLMLVMRSRVEPGEIGRIKIPKAVALRRYDAETSFEALADRVFRALPPPWVIKPAASGSSVGVSIVRRFDDLSYALKKAAEEDEQGRVLAEEYIKGREFTCGVLEHFRGEDHYALPPVEICPPETAEFFNSQVKYDGSTREICPADIHDAMLKKIRATAIAAHTALGCRDYSRVDMILAGINLYVLEVNTLPGLTKESLFPKAAAAVGLSFAGLLDHLLTNALERNKRQKGR